MDSAQITSIIRTRRKEMGISQKDLAKRLDKKQTTYSYIENNLDKANLSTITDIIDQLDMKLLLIPNENL
jgi:transcriptional regulator with XRE-family HTH domain